MDENRAAGSSESGPDCATLPAYSGVWLSTLALHIGKNMINSCRQLPRLFIISGNHDPHCGPDKAIALAEGLKDLPAVMLQLREKKLEARQQYTLALLLKEILHPSGTLLFINERTDIALASGADGVHLPESSSNAALSTGMAQGLITGKSVHSPEAALEAEHAGARYLLFGPVYATPSKAAYGPPQGLERLEAVCRAVSVPVFAVGGITPVNAGACIESGAYGIAAISVFVDTGKLAGTVDNFFSILPS